MVLAADGRRFKICRGIGVTESLACGSDGVAVDAIEMHSYRGRVGFNEPECIGDIVIAHENMVVWIGDPKIPQPCEETEKSHYHMKQQK